MWCTIDFAKSVDKSEMIYRIILRSSRNSRRPDIQFRNDVYLVVLSQCQIEFAQAIFKENWSCVLLCVSVKAHWHVQSPDDYCIIKQIAFSIWMHPVNTAHLFLCPLVILSHSYVLVRIDRHPLNGWSRLAIDRPTSSKWHEIFGGILIVKLIQSMISYPCLLKRIPLSHFPGRVTRHCEAIYELSALQLSVNFAYLIRD